VPPGAPQPTNSNQFSFAHTQKMNNKRGKTDERGGVHRATADQRLDLASNPCFQDTNSLQMAGSDLINQQKGNASNPVSSDPALFSQKKGIQNSARLHSVEVPRMGGQSEETMMGVQVKTAMMPQGN